jgi:hypothetical protein
MRSQTAPAEVPDEAKEAQLHWVTAPVKKPMQDIGTFL